MPHGAAVQKRGSMRTERKKMIAVLGILGAVFAGGNMGCPVYAKQCPIDTEQCSMDTEQCPIDVEQWPMDMEQCLVFTVQEGATATDAPDVQDKAVFSYGEDGLVDGEKEFVIPAAAGDNLDIEITFAGNGADGVLSFAYDRVTEDQMIPNTDSAATDRSGLLNEAVKEGQQQTRIFSVAAIDGDITIKATGKGRVLSIKAAKQAAKAPNEKACVYTVGDSLVQTYAAKYAPQTGWGQTLPLYFDEDVTFVNRALGGRSTGNYMRQGRLNQVLCEIAPGDCVLIEFGHNDAGSGNKDRYVSVADYKKLLADVYIKGIRDRGATPVLVTLCNRNQYLRDTGEFTVSFPQYVEAMREIAAETGTLLIDLNAITVEHFTGLNQELGAGITNDIIYNYAIAGAYEGEYAKGVKDNTHLQYYGAKLVGGFVAEELQKLDLPGISEHYVPLDAPNEAPKAPDGIAEKKYEGFVSRITWTPCEGADYYKVMAAEIVERNAQGGAAAEDGSGLTTESTSPSVYELAGEFEIAGYTTVCDFANMDAKADRHYAYKITAVNAAGESPESEIFTFGLELAARDEPETGSLENSEPGGAVPSESQQERESGKAQLFVIIVVIAVILAAAVVTGVMVRKKGRDQ